MSQFSDLANRFEYHKPNLVRIDAHERTREVFFGLAQFIEAVCPSGRETALAITKLEEAMFWANAAIARSDCDPYGADHRWPWVTHHELRSAIAALATYEGIEMSKISDYAQAVDAETNRLADVVAALQAKVASSDAANAAELAAAFDPVLEHLRSVGVAGDTAPPVSDGSGDASPPASDGSGDAAPAGDGTGDVSTEPSDG